MATLVARLENELETLRLGLEAGYALPLVAVMKAQYLAKQIREAL